MRCPAMFEKENALPRAELHFAVHNRYGFAGACQDHADMRWHIIAALGTVRKVIGVLRHESIEEFFQVSTCSGIGILHDDNAATGVLNKNSHGPVSPSASVDLCLNFIGDFVKALMVGADFELVVMNVHRNEQSPNTCACHPEVAAATDGPPKCEQQARIRMFLRGPSLRSG